MDEISQQRFVKQTTCGFCKHPIHYEVDSHGIAVSGQGVPIFCSYICEDAWKTGLDGKVNL